jgi:hypothetical protein
MNRNESAASMPKEVQRIAEPVRTCIGCVRPDDTIVGKSVAVAAPRCDRCKRPSPIAVIVQIVPPTSARCGLPGPPGLRERGSRSTAG